MIPPDRPQLTTKSFRLWFFAVSLICSSMTQSLRADVPRTLTITDDNTGEVVLSLTEASEFILDAQKRHILVRDAATAKRFEKVPLKGSTLKLLRGDALVSSWAVRSPVVSSIQPDPQPLDPIAVFYFDRVSARIELRHGDLGNTPEKAR